MKKTVLVSVLALALILMASSRVSADTIVLKSGKIINAKILKKTQDYIVINFANIKVKYMMDEVDRVQESVQGISGSTLSVLQGAGGSLILPSGADFMEKAVGFLGQKQFEEGAQYFMSIASQHHQSYVFAGIFYYWGARFDQALAALDEYNRLERAEINGSGLVAIYRGLSYEALGDQEGAKKALSHAVEIFRQDPFPTTIIISDILRGLNRADK